MSESATDMLAVEFDSYGGPDVLELRRRSAPEAAPGEVLVRVRAASVNPVDWKIRSGMLQKFFPVVFPVITGRDGAGEIMTVGGGAEPSLVGKRVLLSGAARSRHLVRQTRSASGRSSAFPRVSVLRTRSLAAACRH